MSRTEKDLPCWIMDSYEQISRFVKLKKIGRFWKGLCPFHKAKHYEFIFNPKRDTWHCFGECNTGGDIESFLGRIARIEAKLP